MNQTPPTRCHVDKYLEADWFTVVSRGKYLDLADQLNQGSNRVPSGDQVHSISHLA